MKTWTKEEMIDLMNRNEHVLYGAMLAIYNKQTWDEKNIDQTNHRNNVGFTPGDAKILSSLSKQLIVKRCLSEKQICVARTRMMKYAGQLVRIKEGKA